MSDVLFIDLIKAEVKRYPHIYMSDIISGLLEKVESPLDIIRHFEIEIRKQRGEFELGSYKGYYDNLKESKSFAIEGESSNEDSSSTSNKVAQK